LIDYNIFLSIMKLPFIDCGKIFGRDTVQDHTQCITETVSLSFILTFLLMDHRRLVFVRCDL